MASALDTKLAALATLSPTELRSEWERVYRSPAPRISTDLLIRGIAWQLQVKAHGGPSPSTMRELRAMAAGDRGGETPAPIPVLRPGTQLMRSWGNKSWSVIVVEDGFLFEGERYASLSPIARMITGAHWSGPRFFGLTRRGSKPASRSAPGPAPTSVPNVGRWAVAHG